MSVKTEIIGASITVLKRLEWADTDAAGHNHFSVAVRWLEEVEHELRRLIELPTELTGSIPRVHVEVDYRERIWFNQEVNVTVGVIAVGRSSVSFGFVVENLEGGVCIEGRHTAVHSPDPSGGSQPWPESTVKSFLAKT
ncbi:MAG: acyl-CoA thioesterase [Candidatus Nanopelagicales bacterium]|nr:acyl-CoA thioesterase [Candidatus Nanopelagicales bacterium]